MASNSCVYESMFILDSNRYAREPAAVSGQVSEMIEKCGGEVLASRMWNEQRLAFSIRGQRKGTYWLAYFRMDTASMPDFDRTCQLNENVLRSLTLKVDPRLVDTLVAHARGERPPEESPEDETPQPVPVPAADAVDQAADQAADQAEGNAAGDTSGAESTPTDASA